MKKLFCTAIIAASAFVSSAALADTVEYNGTPAAGWQYGNGNDYAPANSAIRTTDAGDQIYLRGHIYQQKAPASVGSLYSFALGSNLSYDWGITSHTGSFAGVTAQLTFTNVATGQEFHFDPFSLPDNTPGASAQNSGRLVWYPIGFNANVDDTYNVSLDVFGLEGGPKSLAIGLQVGAGAVPEPATWAMMLLGFGTVGFAMRRRQAPRHQLV